MNWFVLFVLLEKQERIIETLKGEGMDAFSPMLEYYRRDIQTTTHKRMFPGYVFVRSPLTRMEFEEILRGLGDRRNGIVKELQRNQMGKTAAEGSDYELAVMRPEEIEFLNTIINEDGMVPMSYGFIGNKGKAVVADGPLEHYADRICKLDKHNHLAWLDLNFFDRQIKMGLTVSEKYRKLMNASENKKGKIAEDVRIVDESTGEMVDFDPEQLSRMMMNGEDRNF